MKNTRKLWLMFIIALIGFAAVSCDAFLEWLNEDPNNDTCTHTWTWVVTTPATTQADGVSSQRCSKCNKLSGKTQVIPKLGGGEPNKPPESGGYGLALRVFSSNVAALPHYETFTVNYQLRNSSSEQFPINGQFGAALINNDGSIAGIVGTRDFSSALDPGWSTNEMAMTCNVPFTVTPGQYQLRMIVRPAGGEWRIVSTSVDNAPTSISFQVSVNNNVVVAPMIKTQWSQFTPYNDLFPTPYENYNGTWITDDRNQLVTDCGTTAMAQILAYYRYPVRAVGESTNIVPPDNITVPRVFFENYPFDWANMRNTYTAGDPGTVQERNAVAELMFIFGMARGNKISFPRILVENFGYDRTIQHLERRFYTDTQWEAIIRQQLDAGYPVYYWGGGTESNPGNHAFVVNGYDKTGKFHINMGWGGSDDGWYTVTNVNPRDYSFTENQLMYINIMPDKGGIGSNEFALTEFTSGSTSVSRSVQFAVTINLRSAGFFPGGQAGIALVDNNNNIVTDIGSRSLGNTWQPGSRWTDPITINCTVPGTVNAGQYSLRVVTRETDGKWKIVTLSDRDAGTPNSINITVQ